MWCLSFINKFQVPKNKSANCKLFRQFYTNRWNYCGQSIEDEWTWKVRLDMGLFKDTYTIIGYFILFLLVFVFIAHIHDIIQAQNVENNCYPFLYNFQPIFKKIQYFKTWRYISIKTIIFNSFCLNKFEKLDNRRNHYNFCVSKEECCTFLMSENPIAIIEFE